MTGRKFSYFTQSFVLFVLLSLFFSVLSGYPAVGERKLSSTVDGVYTTQAAGPKLISSSVDAIVISLESPEPEQLLTWARQPQDKNKAGLGEVTLVSQEFAPQLPLYRSLVGIPPTGEYELKVLVDRHYELEGVYEIASVPAMHLNGQAVSGFGETAGEAASIFDDFPVIFPDQPARIAEEIWVRDQRVLVVEFFPLQYSAYQKKLVYYPRLEVELIRLNPHLALGQDQGQTTEYNDSVDLFDGSLDRMVINYATARDWQARPAVAPLVNNFPIADGEPGLKITVDHAGIFQITYQDMLNAGMDLGGIDPANLSLLNIDSAVAYEFIGDSDQVFEPGESVRFYGELLPSERLEAMYQQIMAPWVSLCPSVCDIRELIENYTNENVYWLYVSNTPGLRMQTQQAAPLNDYPIPEVFTDTQYAEQDILWYPMHFTSADVWFWQRANTVVPVTYTLPIELGMVANIGPEAVLRGEVYSRNNVAHHTVIALNSTTVLDSYWSGKKRYVFETTFPLSVLQNGLNNLDWGTQIVSSSEYLLFDRFQIEYSRQFTAVDDRLAFNYPIPGSWQYQITGLLSADVEAYDITNPLAPIRVAGAQMADEGVGYRINFEITQAVPSKYFIAGGSAVETPKALHWYQPPELEPAAGADYIFIVHQDFLDAIQVLADYRASQGMRTLVVDVADIYDQFGFGIYHPIAIRNYLERAMLTWAGEQPKYVLLVGDGTFEIRQSENVIVDEPNYIPPVLGIVDPQNGEIDITSLLAAAIGTDIIPDLFIGRIPAKTASDVNVVVAKTIGYEQSATAAWQRKITYIADDRNIGDTSDFEYTSDNLALNYTPPGFEADKYYVTDYCATGVSTCPALTDAIITSLNNTGSLFVNYMGHGSINAWATSPTVVNRDTVSSLNNGSRLPVVLSWDCLDGFFYYPSVTTFNPPNLYTPSLVETWLLSDGKGAVATFSPTGSGINMGHSILASGFYDSIFVDGNWVLGPASLSAKLKLFATGLNLDLVYTYSIFGDPALRLKTAWMTLSSSALAGYGIAGEILNYQITVQNKGSVDDSYAITYSGNTWTTSLPSTLGPISAGEQGSFTVDVEIPTGAVLGDRDFVTVSVTSQADSSLVGIINIQSMVAGEQVYLPTIYKP